MQEYLNKTTYEYKLAHTKPDGEWAEIPEGADFYVKSKIIEDNFFFCMDNSGVIETYDTMLKNSWHREILTTKDLSKNYEILWQRPAQPEALPFIDDNPQSLNEQYAEIEQVRQQSIEVTLAERGSRYGDFESVAGTTRALMRVLSNGDTVGELSASQHEALHMICSKMARIVNGDPNYKDNWHDIGGYAKLIENNI